MPDQTSMDNAREFNAALDGSLRTTGIVDRVLYLEFRDAYTYQAATSVAWLAAKLEVLRDRLDQGLPLSLFSPASSDQVFVKTKSAFEQWAETNFPGAIE